VNQIEETKAQKAFRGQINRNIYMELTALEEEQIALEGRLQDEKKAVMRNHLVKTINDNKVKIQQKKDEIVLVKQAEKEEQAHERALLEEEQRKLKEQKVHKKHEMKRMMSKQLEELSKKKEDA